MGWMDGRREIREGGQSCIHRVRTKDVQHGDIIIRVRILHGGRPQPPFHNSFFWALQSRPTALAVFPYPPRLPFLPCYLKNAGGREAKVFPTKNGIVGWHCLVSCSNQALAEVLLRPSLPSWRSKPLPRLLYFFLIPRRMCFSGPVLSPTPHPHTDASSIPIFICSPSSPPNKIFSSLVWKQIRLTFFTRSTLYGKTTPTTLGSFLGRSFFSHSQLAQSYSHKQHSNHFWGGSTSNRLLYQGYEI